MRNLFFYIILIISFNSYAQIDKMCDEFQKLKMDTTNKEVLKLRLSKFNSYLASKYQIDDNHIDSVKKALSDNCQVYKTATLLTLNVKEATPLKPLSNSDYYDLLCTDKHSGKWIAWTKEQSNLQIDKCYKELQAQTNSNKICTCGIEHLSKNMNYSTFIKSSEYQQGKAISTFYEK